MKTYKKPIVKIFLADEDIITTSGIGGGNGDDNELPTVPILSGSVFNSLTW